MEGVTPLLVADSSLSLTPRPTTTKHPQQVNYARVGMRKWGLSTNSLTDLPQSLWFVQILQAYVNETDINQAVKFI